LRLQNEQYLRQHPEIKHILGYLLRNLLHDRPEQVPDYIASLLTDSDLRSKVDADTQAQQELHQWHLQMFQKLAEVNGN
jgi:hypothetical protein